MSTTYRITECGDETDFNTLADAEQAIRACGGEFAAISLKARGGRIYDGDEVIGYVVTGGQLVDVDSAQK